MFLKKPNQDFVTQLCVFVGVLKRLEEEDLDEGVRRRLKDSSETPGALWHIYLNKDMDRVREFLQKVSSSTVVNEPVEPFRTQRDCVSSAASTVF